MSLTREEIFARAGLSLPKQSITLEPTNTSLVKKIEEKYNSGVCYYNIDNKDNKDNKDNTVLDLPLDLASLSEACASQGVIGGATLDGKPTERGQREWEPLDSEDFESGLEKAETENPDPMISPEMVDRCIVTFYDNGEKPKGSKKQRYKVNITINPVSAPNEKWEFIGNLNTDRRIFVRNLPEHNRDVVLEFVDSLRKITKDKYNSVPKIGKIHYNSKWDPEGQTHSQKEDSCAVAVYWTGTNWRCSFMLWDYMQHVDLTSEHLTEKQIKANVKATSSVIYGPNSVSKKEQSSKRKPTFRERMQNKK